MLGAFRFKVAGLSSLAYTDYKHSTNTHFSRTRGISTLLAHCTLSWFRFFLWYPAQEISYSDVLSVLSAQMIKCSMICVFNRSITASRSILSLWAGIVYLPFSSSLNQGVSVHSPRCWHFTTLVVRFLYLVRYPIVGQLWTFCVCLFNLKSLSLHMVEYFSRNWFSYTFGSAPTSAQFPC